VVEYVHVGQRSYVHIFVPSGTLARYLPAVSEELTDDESIVLCATACLKASYGGVSNLRYREAHRITSITEERWDTAKAALIDRKLLNRAGAITSKGRNAIGDKRLDAFAPGKAVA
jgi:hypothetical protein